MNALMNVEAKKKYEFLASFSAIMDAHLRYFKLVSSLLYSVLNFFASGCGIHLVDLTYLVALFFQGFDLLSELEPFIHQVCLQYPLLY